MLNDVSTSEVVAIPPEVEDDGSSLCEDALLNKSDHCPNNT